ncbi:helix-turn-helix domain-containing protein [Burkholderia gladioli]|uniref:helix-turn-helix domain-containing protein n=1 Tax=Burkholderia gladioli TaxID=28095 RepID=UPI00321B0005
MRFATGYTRCLFFRPRVFRPSHGNPWQPMAQNLYINHTVMKDTSPNHGTTGCAACAPPAPAPELATVDLAGAAAILRAHPETVRLKAKAGELPGRKVGKCWIFSTVALQRYLAGEWIPRVVQGDHPEESKSCRSTNGKPVPTGNTSCTPLAAERQYRAALAPATRSKRKNSMTG